MMLNIHYNAPDSNKAEYTLQRIGQVKAGKAKMGTKKARYEQKKN